MTPAVEGAFAVRNCDVVRYVDYWDQLTARTDEDLFRRFLFAFCSVHTTWEGNCNGYNAIKDFEEWLGKEEVLLENLKESGVGLHNNRAKWIGQFACDYWLCPGRYARGRRESWAAYRDRIEPLITGLGPAKTSFALELAYPLDAEVVCLDIHMLRLYGKKDQNLRVHEYHRYEHDWVSRARAVEIPSYIVRQVHWDALQGRPDSRYWSHVLET